MRERWLGASGLRVPEIAVEGEDVELGDDSVRSGGEDVRAVVLEDVEDVQALEEAHRAGVAVVVRAEDETGVATALARPEVSCVAVPPERRELRELDLRRLKYG